MFGCGHAGPEGEQRPEGPGDRAGALQGPELCEQRLKGALHRDRVLADGAGRTQAHER